MPEPNRRWPLYGALFALYLLHNDLWLWNDTRLVFGLPVGLAYHVGFCLVTSVVLAALVKWAWPDFEAMNKPRPESDRSGASSAPMASAETGRETDLL